jgi:hypothetical protein
MIRMHIQNLLDALDDTVHARLCKRIVLLPFESLAADSPKKISERRLIPIGDFAELGRERLWDRGCLLGKSIIEGN